MKPYLNIQEAIRDFSDRIERLERTRVNLRFVIKREQEGMFWKEDGWCFSIDHAMQFNDETTASAFAQELATDWDENMRVILRGPYVVNTLRPPRPAN